jgi:hypothetical protein
VTALVAVPDVQLSRFRFLWKSFAREGVTTANPGCRRNIAGVRPAGKIAQAPVPQRLCLGRPYQRVNTFKPAFGRPYRGEQEGLSVTLLRAWRSIAARQGDPHYLERAGGSRSAISARTVNVPPPPHGKFRDFADPQQRELDLQVTMASAPRLPSLPV